MKLNALKHLELCPDCQEKVNQAYFSTSTSYEIKLRGDIYFAEYKDKKRTRKSLKTRDRATAEKVAAELVLDTDDYKNLSKYDQAKSKGKPYHVNERADSISGIWYLCWFDGKNSHQRSTRTTDKELADKVAEVMWQEISKEVVEL